MLNFSQFSSLLELPCTGGGLVKRSKCFISGFASECTGESGVSSS